MSRKQEHAHRQHRFPSSPLHNSPAQVGVSFSITAISKLHHIHDTFKTAWRCSSLSESMRRGKTLPYGHLKKGVSCVWRPLREALGGFLVRICKGFPRGFRSDFEGFPRGFRGFPRGFRASGAMLWAFLGTFAVSRILYENVHFLHENHGNGFLPCVPRSPGEVQKIWGEQPPFINLNREEGGGTCGRNGSLVKVLEFYGAVV